MAELTYIGKPARRVDALEKVMGKAKYIADRKLPGMLHARCLRSDVPHARIVKLDVTRGRCARRDHQRGLLRARAVRLPGQR